MTKLKSYYFKATGEFLEDGSAEIEYTGTVFAYDRDDAESIIYQTSWSTPRSISGTVWDVDIMDIELTEYDEDPETLADLGRGIVEWDTDETERTMERFESSFSYDEFDEDEYYNSKYGRQ